MKLINTRLIVLLLTVVALLGCREEPEFVNIFEREPFPYINDVNYGPRLDSSNSTIARLITTEFREMKGYIEDIRDVNDDAIIRGQIKTGYVWHLDQVERDDFNAVTFVIPPLGDDLDVSYYQITRYNDTEYFDYERSTPTSRFNQRVTQDDLALQGRIVSSDLEGTSTLDWDINEQRVFIETRFFEDDRKEYELSGGAGTLTIYEGTRFDDEAEQILLLEWNSNGGGRYQYIDPADNSVKSEGTF